MLRRYTVLGFLILAGQSLTFGQASAHRPGFPREGKSVLKLTPVNPADSLEQLVIGADLIIDGTVSSIQQPLSRSVSARQVIVETHAIVSVSSVLKGSLPKQVNSVLVAQIGGRSGGSETEVERDALLEAGSRYILFLQGDENRVEVVNSTGLKRFGVVGIWSGKVMILDGKVRFLPSVSKALAEYNGWDVFSFSQRVRDMVTGKYVPPSGQPLSPLPPHPGPPAARGQ